MTVEDRTGCKFDAKASNNPSGAVWFGTVIDGEITEHQITPDAADALAAELIEAARQARSGKTFAQGAREAQMDAQPPIEGFDPKASWHTDSDM